MGLIEQAAKRLEELRRAGVDVPEGPGRSGEPQAPPARITAEPAARAQPRAPRLQIDLAGLASRGFVTPEHPRSQIADEFRVIKRPLIANATGKGASTVKHGNLVMVTSSIPGEGKTFTAINLAMSIAMEVDRTVLLVDGDFARPSLPRTLGIPDTPGLLDVLTGDSIELEDVLHPTNVDKLSFLSSGSALARTAEALASNAMSALLGEMATRNPDRIVVFDSPPLLVTTEARALAARMGQIVFVVGADSTLQSDVARALATIESCPVKLGVLNKSRAKGQGAYGYGYGYGY